MKQDIAAAAMPARAVERVGRWELFHSNRAAWAAVLALCASARESIAIEQYIFQHSGIGREILDLLTTKARQGVRVRIVADAFGSRSLRPSEGAAELCKAGGEIRYFNGVRAALRRPNVLLHRLHRKTVICDGRHLMTGGSCFAPRMRDWRDSMVQVEGELARDALHEFEDSWRHAAGEPSPPRVPPPAAGRSQWSYMVMAPCCRPKRQDYYNALVARIERAERKVTMMSPYVVPGGPFWPALFRAVQRGVSVRLIIPAKSDQRVIDRISLAFARRLAGHGLEMYGYEPSMLHAKLSVIDDDWAVVGSFNLGIDSFRMNSEGAVLSRTRPFHQALSGQLELDLAQSRRLG